MNWKIVKLSQTVNFMSNTWKHILKQYSICMVAITIGKSSYIEKKK